MRRKRRDRDAKPIRAACPPRAGDRGRRRFRRRAGDRGPRRFRHDRAAGDTPFLRFATDDTARLTVTRWGAIDGGQTSADPEQNRLAALRDLRTSAAPPLACVSCDSRPNVFLEQWGFDVFDLDYQVDLAGEDGEVRVLRLSEEAGVDGVVALLEDRAYESEDVGGGQLWSGSGSLSNEWIRFTRAMSNVGVLADERTLVVGLAADEIRGVLDAAASDGDGGIFGDALAALGSATSAMVLPPCPAFDSALALLGADSPPDIETVEQAIEDFEAAVAELGTYSALALGWQGDGDAVTGRIALVYEDAEAAAADLDARAAIAREGVNQSGEPLSETQFTVADARVEGQAVVVEIAPVDTFARLSGAVESRDTVWAACG